MSRPGENLPATEVAAGDFILRAVDAGDGLTPEVLLAARGDPPKLLLAQVAFAGGGLTSSSASPVFQYCHSRPIARDRAELMLLGQSPGRHFAAVLSAGPGRLRFEVADKPAGTLGAARACLAWRVGKGFSGKPSGKGGCVELAAKGQRWSWSAISAEPERGLVEVREIRGEHCLVMDFVVACGPRTAVYGFELRERTPGDD